MDKVQEIFALPESPRIATVIDGTPLYTSDRIKQRFVKALTKSDYLKDVIPEITDLVIKKNAIVPCWQSKGAIRFIARKVLQSIKGTGFAALYRPDEGRIYIILDNYVNWFMGYPNEVLFRIASHELVHYCAHKNFLKFVMIFRNYINDYYVIFFKDIFKIPRKEDIDSLTWKIIGSLSKKFPDTASVHEITTKYKEAMEPLRTFSKLSNFDKIVDDMSQTIKIALTYGGRAQDILFSGYKHILDPMYRTYDSLGVPTYGNVCYQELWRPDEVIAMHVEKKILKNKFDIMLKTLS